MLITYVLIILSFPKGFVESPFLIFVLNTIFSIIFGILEGLFQVFWYSTTPLADPVNRLCCKAKTKTLKL